MSQAPTETTRGVKFAEVDEEVLPVTSSSGDGAEDAGEGDEQRTRRRQSSRSAKRKPSIFEKVVDPWEASIDEHEHDNAAEVMADRSLSRMTVPIEAVPVEEEDPEEEEELTCAQKMASCCSEQRRAKTASYWKKSIMYYVNSNVSLAKEIRHECIPSCTKTPTTSEILSKIHSVLVTFIHIPRVPSMHRPGWLLRYIVGPHDWALWESFLSDFIAGITVGLTLIPQGLSYASLANMPPVNGLYASILTQAGYAVFGSSMKVALGPVAIVSLLTGAIVNKYGITPQSTDAIDCGAQACLCVGIILCSMGLLNMGSFINLLSHPVMSGFTTAAAMLIGLSQLNSAFGFVYAPKQGQPGFDYNYEVMKWYSENWNHVETYGSALATCNSVDYLKKQCTSKWTDSAGKSHYLWEKFIGFSYKNHYAIKICFGLYVPMMFFVWFKQQLRPTPKRKRQYWFRILVLLLPLVPFICLIIGGGISYHIKKNDNFYYLDFDQNVRYSDMYALGLKIVGPVPAGANIIRIPNFKQPWGQFFADVIPLTLISFMESYSVSRRIAAQFNELHILHASQEMFANGAANLLGSISSAYPVSGSFSRSSLNAAAGARTPMAKVVTLCTILLAVGVATSAFEFIPQAVLSAVIFAAISQLICISDFWEAWKHSKKDFFTMLVTAVITFVFDTSTGLAVGIGTSVLVFLIDAVVAPSFSPELCEAASDSAKNVDIVKIHCDLNFLTAARVKDFISPLTLMQPAKADASGSRGDYLHARISESFDYALIQKQAKCVDRLPAAIVIDLTHCHVCDLTGLQCLAEIMHETRLKKVKCLVINESDKIREELISFHIANDSSSPEVNLEEYLSKSQMPKRDAHGHMIAAPSPAPIKEEKDIEATGDIVDASSVEMIPVPIESESA